MSEYEFELDLDEMLEKLATDDSWEEDPEVRAATVFTLRMEIG